jgi:hypothetical protein
LKHKIKKKDQPLYDHINQSKQNFNVNTIDEAIITFHDNNFNIIRANKIAKKILKLPPLDGKEIKCYGMTPVV